MERKTRMTEEAKDNEIKKELNSKFKANPIPADLNPERYKAFIKKMEE